MYETPYDPDQPHTRNPDPPLPDFHNYEGDYCKVYSLNSNFTPELYFYLRMKQIPNVITYHNINGKPVINQLCSHYGVGMTHALIEKSVDYNTHKTIDELTTVQLSDNIIICHCGFSDEFKILYNDQVIWEELNYFDNILRKNTKAQITHRLNLLVYEEESGAFRLKEFKLSENDVDINTHYNDDFAPINEVIMQKLSQNKSKGIVLLHGSAGTGKTSYIRYLVKRVNKKLIYIPSSLAYRLGNPDFIPFLVKHSGSILIIEDAEDILEERKGGSNGTISNLLNLSDGLLSDCLNIQIICTFNAPLTRIDHALLRKGRVIASYEFKSLAKEKSNNLLKALDIEHQTEKDLTLAEIFYLQDLDFSNKNKKAIGFG